MIHGFWKHLPPLILAASVFILAVSETFSWLSNICITAVRFTNSRSILIISKSILYSLQLSSTYRPLQELIRPMQASSQLLRAFKGLCKHPKTSKASPGLCNHLEASAIKLTASTRKLMLWSKAKESGKLVFSVSLPSSGRSDIYYNVHPSIYCVSLEMFVTGH